MCSRPLHVLLSCLVCASPIAAQTTASFPPATASSPHAPDPEFSASGYSQGLLVPLQGLFVPPVAGEPFHAKVQAEVTRQLPDGTTIQEKYYNQEARDGEGRSYREVRAPVPLSSDREPALLRTIVYDPKMSLMTICVPGQMTCSQSSMRLAPENDSSGASQDGKSVLVRESLGTKTMDGLQVAGTRETRTYNAGAFGNDKPVVVTKEIWYSPQLRLNLSVTRIDPRSGTQKLEVTDLKRGEPGTEWFTVPDGYRLIARRVVTPGFSAQELTPLIERSVPGMSPGELRSALQPVEAAIAAYAKAHAEAAPNDNIDNFAGQLRMQLSTTLRMMQQHDPFTNMPFAQAQADQRLNADYQQVVTSPCLNKPSPGDPPTMPKNEVSLREEERAWVGVRDAWTAFLASLFPNTDSARFAWQITNGRDLDLHRMEAVLRNRGCTPQESIALQLASVVTGMNAAHLVNAVKPVDEAIDGFAKAHAESAPHDEREFFVRATQQNLLVDLRMRQQGHSPTRDESEEADLRLNQAYRAVIGSPCLDKLVPADPPNAPVSAEKLRAEERAWIAMRDAWLAFMRQLYPGDSYAGFDTTLTRMRTNQLEQIKGVLRNRGCKLADNQ